MPFLKKIFGDKIRVPKFERIDIDKELERGIKSVQENLGDASEAARGITQAETDIAMDMLERVAPGSRQVIDQMTKNILSAQRGELPQDVIRLVQDQAAARSFGRGISGTEAAQNVTLRDLGLTSLQRINQGQQEAAQALQLFRGFSPRANVSQFFLSPAARLNFLQGERNMQFNRDMKAAEVAAQPAPGFGFLTGIAGQALGTGLGMALGNRLGGGGSRGGQAGFQPVSSGIGSPISPESFNFRL